MMSTHRRWMLTLAYTVFAATMFCSAYAVAQDAAAAYNAALEAMRHGVISPQEWRKVSEELKRTHGLRINPVNGYAIGSGPAQPPAAPSQAASAAGNGPGIHSAVPLCGSQAVKDKVLHAIYRDLGKLRLPTNNMQDVDEAVARLAPSNTPVALQARQNMSRAGRVSLDHIAACQPTNGHPLAVLVVLNPRNTSQWGVGVINYGLPNRVAEADLGFMN